MQAVAFGLLTDTAGAQTPLTSDRSLRCFALLFRARGANRDIVNVGVAGFHPGGAGQIGELQTPSAGMSDELWLRSDGGNSLVPADYAVKPLVAGDGVYVTGFTS